MVGAQCDDIQKENIFLKALVDSASEAIIGLSKTLDGTIQTWNLGAEKFYDYSAEEMVGRNVSLLVPPGYPNDMPEIIARIRKGERVEDYETVRMRKDGIHVDVSLNVTPILDAEGRIIGGCAVARDITRRKQIEQEVQNAHDLAESLNRINELIHSTLDFDEIMRGVADKAAGAIGSEVFAIGLFEGRDYVVSYPCEKIREMTGWRFPLSEVQEAETVLNLRDVAVLAEPQKAKQLSLEPIRGLGIKAMLVTPLIIREEAIGLLNFYYYEHQLPHPAPHVDFARKLANSVSLAVENASLFEQVRKSENTLRESESLLRDVLNNLPVGVFIIDSKGRIIQTNPATFEIWGVIKSGDMEQYHLYKGKGWWAETGTPIAADEWAGARAIARGEISLNEVIDIEGFDGSRKTILNSALPLLDEVGTIKGAIVVVQDITIRRKAEQELERTLSELERSNRELELFAYAVSHDLREPLRTISSYLGLVKKRYKDRLDATGDEFIHFAVDGAERLDRMILDLLQYSRVQREEIDFQPVHLFDVWLDVLENISALIEQNDARITTDPLPVVHGSRSHLVRLFQNLLVNAVTYRDERRPEIHIGAVPWRETWRISINDNGIGIKPEHRERIFQIFQRLHTQSEYPGTGIGLAICKKIVERHGGRIWVESEPGKGSTFYFTLPKA
jgi:PAS domain S-box-containing protein